MEQSTEKREKRKIREKRKYCRRKQNEKIKWKQEKKNGSFFYGMYGGWRRTLLVRVGGGLHGDHSSPGLPTGEENTIQGGPRVEVDGGRAAAAAGELAAPILINTNGPTLPPPQSKHNLPAHAHIHTIRTTLFTSCFPPRRAGKAYFALDEGNKYHTQISQTHFPSPPPI